MVRRGPPAARRVSVAAEVLVRGPLAANEQWFGALLLVVATRDGVGARSVVGFGGWVGFYVVRLW